MAIPTIPVYTGGVANPDGSQDQQEFTTNMFNQLSYEAELAPSLNNTVNEMNTVSGQVDTNAAIAQNSADTAQAAANFEGEFVVGVTSAEKGKSYSYDGEVWLCLQNTTITPEQGSSAWKLSVGEQYVTTAQGDVLGGKLFKGSNGEYVQNGDLVPVGTTHLRVLIGGESVILVAWDALNLPATVTTTPTTDNGTGGYDVITDQGTFEFVTLENKELRDQVDIRGWGAADNQDVTEALKAAALLGYVVCPVELSGTVTERIQFEFGYDLSKVTLKIPSDFDPVGDNESGSVLMTIQDKVTFQTNETMSEGQTGAGSLSGRGESIMYLDNPDTMYTRFNGGVTTLINKKDILYVDNDGLFRSTPLFKDFSGTTTVTVAPDNVQPITVYNPVVLFESVPSSPVPSLFLTSRNRVKQVGGRIDKLAPISDTAILANAMSRSLICGWPEFESINNNGPEGNFYYGVDLLKTCFIEISKCYNKIGWALQDGEVYRKLVMKDCEGTRFGGHYDAIDSHYIRCFSNMKGFRLAGGGDFIVEDCGHTIDYTAAETYRDCIVSRNDYGWCHDGKVRSKGRFTIRQIGQPDGFCTLIKPRKGLANALCNGKDVVKAPDVEFDEVFFDNTEMSLGGTADFTLFLIDGTPQQDFEFPDRIKLDQVKWDYEDRYNRQIIRPVYLDPTTNTDVVQKKVYVELSRFVSFGSSVYAIEASVPASDRANVRLDWVVDLFKCESFSAGISAPSTWEFIVNNCIVVDWTGNRNADRDESKTTIRNSKLTGDDFANTGASSGNWQWYNNEFTNGGSVVLSDNIKVAQGNVFNVTATISGTTIPVAELFSGYRDPAIYQ